jgi:hypothetical protein
MPVTSSRSAEASTLLPAAPLRPLVPEPELLLLLLARLPELRPLLDFPPRRLLLLLPPLRLGAGAAVSVLASSLTVPPCRRRLRAWEQPDVEAILARSRRGRRSTPPAPAQDLLPRRPTTAACRL